MALKIINIVIFMGVSVVVSTSQYGTSCCPRGQRVLKRNNAMCVDPKTNRTENMPLTCGEKRMVVINERQSNFKVNDDAKLHILLENREDVVFEANTFCVGHNVHNRRVAVLCIERSEDRLIDGAVYSYFMIVSSVFLVVTAIIYATRRDLRDVHGMSIINFCGSFAIGLGILAGMNLVPYSNMNLCALRGFCAYFFLVVSFFWMNALSVQILLNMRHHYSGSAGYGDAKGFVWYAGYAWGCPAALTALVAIVNYLPGEHLKPGIGLDTCWFFDKKQQWLYMYSVISVLIAMNICIFIYASVLLWKRTKTTEAVRSKFLMTIRLFVVMGVPWIFEMISTLPPPHLVWEVLDLINTLQGVFIFLVLCVPLLPNWSRRTNEAIGVQYNLNIKIDQPYQKLVG